MMKKESFHIVINAAEQATHATRDIVNAKPALTIDAARQLIRKHFEKFSKRQKQLGSIAAPGITYHVIPAVKHTTEDGAGDPAITAEAWYAAEVVEMWDGVTRERAGNTTMMKAVSRLRKVV